MFAGTSCAYAPVYEWGIAVYRQGSTDGSSGPVRKFSQSTKIDEGALAGPLGGAAAGNKQKNPITPAFKSPVFTFLHVSIESPYNRYGQPK